jgi:hypothetical protein
MIPPFREVIEAAHAALQPGGRVGVVDFYDAAPGFRGWLAASHVHLGPERLSALRQRFSRSHWEIHRGLGWRYLLFWGERD